MATTNYPGSLDAYPVPNNGDTISVADHWLGPAVIGIETELGTDPAGYATDVKTRLNTINPSSGLLAADGLQFPGTQSPSADANTLDDYEEGTFTPTWTNLTVGNSPNNAGYYTKIGRQVHVKVIFELGSTSALSSSTPSVTNLPFVSANNNDNRYSNVAYIEDNAIAGYYGVCSITNNSSSMRFEVLIASTTYLQNTTMRTTVPFTWGTNDYFSGDITYMV